MLGEYGSIYIDGGADTLALSTTAVLLDSFAESGGANGINSGSSGAAGIQPDKANNRIKAGIGKYLAFFNMSADIDSDTLVIAQLRKNGSVVASCKGQAEITTDIGQVSFVGTFEITAADIPGTLPTFADPASTGFAGAGAAPNSLCAVDVVISSGAGNPTITVKNASLTLVRVG